MSTDLKRKARDAAHALAVKLGVCEEPDTRPSVCSINCHDITTSLLAFAAEAVKDLSPTPAWRCDGCGGRSMESRSDCWRCGRQRAAATMKGPAR